MDKKQKNKKRRDHRPRASSCTSLSLALIHERRVFIGDSVYVASTSDFGRDEREVESDGDGGERWNDPRVGRPRVAERPRAEGSSVWAFGPSGAQRPWAFFRSVRRRARAAGVWLRCWNWCKGVLAARRARRRERREDHRERREQSRAAPTVTSAPRRRARHRRCRSAESMKR